MENVPNAIEVLDRAVAQYGAPEIINSDYTCEDWHRACEKYGIRISYLNPEATVSALRCVIAKYMDYYNNRRSHQGLDHLIPGVLYAAASA